MREGIEYCWRLAKLFYQCQPLDQKRKRHTFHEFVEVCKSRKTLTTKCVWKCSKRKREFMLAYQVFEQICNRHKCQSKQNKRESDRLTSKGIQEAWTVKLNYDLIEKSFHWSAQDCEVAFIKKLKLDEKKEGFVKHVVMKMKTSLRRCQLVNGHPKYKKIKEI